MKKNLSLVVGAVIFAMSTSSWAIPVWSIVPSSSTTVMVPANAVATVNYTVTNNSITHTLKMVPIPGISQTTTGISGLCTNPFTLRTGASCILSLQIDGRALTTDIHNGPVICQQGVDGQPDAHECYQPSSQAASLNITRSGALAVGDSFGGGTVACSGGWPYLNLIAATVDNSDGIRWNKTQNIYVATGAYSDTDGSSNTTKIITSQGIPISNYAAGLCQNYTDGIYHDWFLPAKNQLNCLFQNKSAIGNFIDAGYWSSTQLDLGQQDGAWFQQFYNAGYQGVVSTNNDTTRVRCVRALTP